MTVQASSPFAVRVLSFNTLHQLYQKKQILVISRVIVGFGGSNYLLRRYLES